MQRFVSQVRELQSSPPSEMMWLVTRKPNLRVVDLGCGNGEFTRQLSDSLPGSDVLGIDSSPEMIREAKTHAHQRLRFMRMSIEEFVARDTVYDVIFSNAVLQLVDNHGAILTNLIKRIAPGGQLVVQMVVMDLYLDERDTVDTLCSMIKSTWEFQMQLQMQVVMLVMFQKADVYKRKVEKLTSRIPFMSPVLTKEAYSSILRVNGGTEVNVFEKAYLELFPDAEAFYEYVAENILSTYLRKLSPVQQLVFKGGYKKVLMRKYLGEAFCCPLKRLFLSAKF